MNPTRLLSHYPPTNPDERAFAHAMQQLATHPDCAHRTHYTPGHFTASAFVITPDYQHIALIFHPKFNRWLQPGGHIEATDPDPESAARREVQEELGLTQLERVGEGLFDIDIHDIPPRTRPPAEPAHQHFDLRFCFVSPQIGFSGEHEARWVKITDVSSIESDESVMRAVRKILSLR